MAELISGWYDDVAAAAVCGATPLIIAVCRDLPMVDELARWLESAVPAMGPMQVSYVAAEQLREAVAGAVVAAAPVVLVVQDSAHGNEEELRKRWTSWNAARDELRLALRPETEDRRRSVVFLVTALRMPEVAAAAPDFLSLAEMITPDSRPFAIDRRDEYLLTAYRKAQRDLELRYQMPTEEVMSKLFDRQPLPREVPESDLERWKAVAEALREAGE